MVMPISSAKIIIGCAVFAAAVSGMARADTLAGAFAAAYETNPTLEIARAALRAADEAIPTARAGLRPNVTATVSSALNHTSINGPVPSSAAAPRSANLTFQQVFFNGGQTRNAIESATSTVHSGRAQLVSTEQVVLLGVVTAYMDLRRDQQFVTLAQNNVRLIREQLRAARDRFAVGEVTKTDVSQAAARLAQAEAALAAQEGQLARAVQAYRRVVGVLPGVLEDPPLLPPLPQSSQAAVDEALSNHPDLQAAQFNEASARSDIKSAIGALLPTLAVNGSVTYALDTGGISEGTTTSVLQLQATVPLYQGGAEYSEIRRTREVQSQRMAEIHDSARDIQQDVENGWSDLQVARVAIRAGRQQVAAARLAFDGVKEEAKLGARTTIDVLDAEQELLDARTDLVTALRDEYVAGYTLLSTIRRLTARDLNLDVGHYDPATHFNEVSDKAFGFKQDELTEWQTPHEP
jgi:outer membrane protein